MRYKKKKKTILIAEDDEFFITRYIDALEHQGYSVVTATTGKEALEKVNKKHGRFDAVVLDIMMKMTKRSKSIENEYLTGLIVAKKLRKKYPKLKLIGFSLLSDVSITEWFLKYGNGFIPKGRSEQKFLDVINLAVYGNYRRKPKAFIVHGHDETMLQDIKNFLTKSFKFKKENILILREQPNLGRTIIEKFEEVSSEIDLVFVLLTPDDIGTSKKLPKQLKRRGKQNVIFELGYFYSQLQHKDGRIILLYKGNLELPSDISGLTYINVTKKIKNNSKAMKMEIKEWL